MLISLWRTEYRDIAGIGNVMYGFIIQKQTCDFNIEHKWQNIDNEGKWNRKNVNNVATL